MATLRTRRLFHRMPPRRLPHTARHGFARPLLLLCGALALGTAGCADIHADAVTGLKQIAEEIDDTPSNDMLLADRGYKALSEANYRDAEVYLTSALEANPSNPYALLNLGVVFEQTERIDQAREMYARVILINPQAEAEEATVEGLVGASLVDIARQNLVLLNQRTAVPDAVPQFATGRAPPRNSGKNAGRQPDQRRRVRRPGAQRREPGAAAERGVAAGEARLSTASQASSFTGKPSLSPTGFTASSAAPCSMRCCPSRPHRLLPRHRHPTPARPKP